MKSRLIIALLLLGTTTAFAQQSDMKMGHPEKPATLMSGLGSLHHPVSTINIEVILRAIHGRDARATLPA